MAITQDMTIGSVVRSYPETIDILSSFGLHCLGCPSSQAETLQEAAFVHDFNIDDLIKALNKNIDD